MREILKTGTLQEVIDTLESEIEEYDMNSIKADLTSNDTFLLCDPVVFIPDVNLFAVCMEYCLGDADGMADWCGTFIFRIKNVSGNPTITDYGYESDDIMTTLYNYTHVDTDKLASMSAGLFTGDLDQIAALLENAILGIELPDPDAVSEVTPALKRRLQWHSKHKRNHLPITVGGFLFYDFSRCLIELIAIVFYNTSDLIGFA